MKPIDLTDYAYHSKKIPAKFLKHTPKTKQQISTVKILMAYAMDFYFIAAGSIFMSLIYQVTAQSFILTKPMSVAFSRILPDDLFSMILPATMVSYFFFSFFFNDGQTLGMNKLKMRISHPVKSIRASLKWALYSSALIFTCGLIYPMTKSWMFEKDLGKHEAHDYLYETLTLERESYHIDLVKKAQDHVSAEEEISEVEEFNIAA